MAPRPSPQTDRVVELVEMLAADGDGGISLAEVSRRLGVHKASCHSMLASLLRSGWLLREPVRKTYHLGPGLARLGAAAASRFPALELARPAMASLAAATGCHCIAFSVGPDHTTVVDQVRSPAGGGHPMPIGTEIPLRPPYGASVVAWQAREDQERWIASLPPGARVHYRKAMAAVRDRGFAVGLHVLPDVRLQELAFLVRTAEVRHDRLGSLAQELTDELVHRHEWFPAALSARRSYDVSHIDTPVFGSAPPPLLMLCLVPVPSTLSGAAIGELGVRLRDAARQLTSALA